MPNRRIHISRPDFTAVSSDRSAKRLISRHFSITSSNKGIGVAVVVSKKVAKSSVERHLLKRRVREVVAPFSSDKNAIIVYARPGALLLPFSEITTEISALLQPILS
jgi:ribonuclease P protein component